MKNIELIRQIWQANPDLSVAQAAIVAKSLMETTSDKGSRS